MEKLLDINTTPALRAVMSERCHAGCTLEMCNSVEQYVATFSAKEMQAYLIAKSHLGSSFSLYKSVGFLQWKNKNGV
jgi:hypothetical protein